MTANAQVLGSRPNRYDEAIEERAHAVVRAYAATRREGTNPYSSLTDVLGQMQREYEDRFLYELVQNAYDAHRGGSKGRIRVVLDVDECEFGALYVANGGEPFGESNVAAICDLASSDKRSDESIGNKGVGFKSVLRVSDWPEIYSASNAGRLDHFDGFCFSFARPDVDYSVLASGDADLTASLRRDVAPYFLPVPIRGSQPAHVVALRRAGFATVIRLPLKSTSARDLTDAALTRLADQDVPLLLFLERLTSLEIVRCRAQSSEETRLTRASTTIDDPGRAPGVRYEAVDLGLQGHWFVASRLIPADQMRTWISESAREGQIEASWEEWSADAHASVAVRSDGQPIQPRLYTFLPMEGQANAPLHGHIHAPFSTKLARVSVDETVRLNASLLDAAAHAAFSAAASFGSDESVLTPEALIDLQAWDADSHDRVQHGASAAAVDVSSLQGVPIERRPDGSTRGSLAETYVWEHDDLTFLTPARLARAADASIVAPRIGGARLDRLQKHHHSFMNSAMTPDADTKAAWVEGVAGTMIARRTAASSWDRFYSDVALVFAGDGAVLRGRRLLLGSDGRLHAPPPPATTKDADRALVFFPPARERNQEEDAVDGDLDLRPPASLSRSLIVLDERLSWTRREGRGSPTLTPARRFFESQRLVRRFRTSDLLEHIGRALEEGKGRRLSRDALRFSFTLFAASRSVDPDELEAVGVRVPTEGGWRPASDAVFSAGWRTPLGGALSRYVAEASSLSADVQDLKERLLVAPTDWPERVADLDLWRSFLEACGVRDGLSPIVTDDGEEASYGSVLTPDRLANRYGLDPATAQNWIDDVHELPDWRASNPQTRHRPETRVSVLPGQAEHGVLNRDGRLAFAELALHGVARWASEGALDMVWVHAERPGVIRLRWPSPISTFLRHSAWLPVGNPGDRQTEVFKAPSTSWYFDDSKTDEAPAYSPLIIRRYRKMLAEGGGLGHLKRLGLNDWGDEEHSVRRLAHLADLVAKDAVPASGLLMLKRACVESWDTVSKWNPDRLTTEVLGLPLVVTRGHELGTWSAATGAHQPVYLDAGADRLAVRLLETSRAPLLVADESGVRRLLGPLTSLLGDDVRSTDDVVVEVLGDGHPRRPDGSGRLLTEHWSWLEPLVGVTLEIKRSRLDRSGSGRRQAILSMLQQVRLCEVADVELRVDGLPVALPGRHRIVPLFDEHSPTLVVARERLGAPLGADELSSVLPATCQLLRLDEYAASVQLAAERLLRSGSTPDAKGLADALDVDEEQVVEALAHIDKGLSDVVGFLAPVVLVLSGPEAGRRLLDLRHVLTSRFELASWLSGLDSPIPDPESVIDAARAAGTLDAFRDSLGLDFGAFNEALSALGAPYAPITHPEDHEQAIRHFVQSNRAWLLGELRQRFLDAFRAHSSLEGYLAARELPLTADPSWLSVCARPSEAMLRQRAEDWLDEQAPASPSPTFLSDIDQLRISNTGVLAAVVERASRLVPAWARTLRKAAPGLWSQPGRARDEVVDTATRQGLLDFEQLTDTDVLNWLDRQGLWPTELPLTLDLVQMGLSPKDLESEEDAQKQQRQERLRRLRVITVDGQEFSAEPTGYTHLFDHVTQTLTDALLETPVARSRLATMASLERRRGTGGPRGSGRRDADLSDPQKASIGLVGEAVAYRWLERHYRECTPSSWVSSYRSAIGGPSGNDSLGYDFEVVLRSRTLLFEVKATSGGETRFALGESEVGKARDCVRGRDDYRILFIAHALDASARTLAVLPNPMDPANARLFRFLGAGLTCLFQDG